MQLKQLEGRNGWILLPVSGSNNLLHVCTNLVERRQLLRQICTMGKIWNAKQQIKTLLAQESPSPCTVFLSARAIIILATICRMHPVLPHYYSNQHRKVQNGHKAKGKILNGNPPILVKFYNLPILGRMPKLFGTNSRSGANKALPCWFPSAAIVSAMPILSPPLWTSVVEKLAVVPGELELKHNSTYSTGKKVNVMAVINVWCSPLPRKLPWRRF